MAATRSQLLREATTGSPELDQLVRERIEKLTDNEGRPFTLPADFQPTQREADANIIPLPIGFSFSETSRGGRFQAVFTNIDGEENDVEAETVALARVRARLMAWV